MIQPVPFDTAFSPYLDPEFLWRSSRQWAASGHDDGAEWLHELAVELIDIRELPECSPASGVRATLLQERAFTDDADRYVSVRSHDDIPF